MFYSHINAISSFYSCDLIVQTLFCFYMYLLTNLFYHCTEQHSKYIYYMITICAFNFITIVNGRNDQGEKKTPEAFWGRIAFYFFLTVSIFEICDIEVSYARKLIIYRKLMFCQLARTGYIIISGFGVQVPGGTPVSWLRAGFMREKVFWCRCHIPQTLPVPAGGVPCLQV